MNQLRQLVICSSISSKKHETGRRYIEAMDRIYFGECGNETGFESILSPVLDRTCYPGLFVDCNNVFIYICTANAG